MYPAARAFNGDDLVRTTFQECAVVADHQDGGRTRPKFVLQPLTRGNVEVVVGFVQQEYVGSRVQQQVEYESLALSTRKFRDQTREDVVHLALDASLGGSLPL